MRRYKVRVLFRVLLWQPSDCLEKFFVSRCEHSIQEDGVRPSKGIKLPIDCLKRRVCHTASAVLQVFAAFCGLVGCQELKRLIFAEHGASYFGELTGAKAPPRGVFEAALVLRSLITYVLL